MFSSHNDTTPQPTIWNHQLATLTTGIAAIVGVALFLAIALVVPFAFMRLKTVPRRKTPALRVADSLIATRTLKSLTFQGECI